MRAVHIVRGRPPVSGNRFVSVFSVPIAFRTPGSNVVGQLGYEDTLSRGTGVNEMGDLLPVVDLGQEQRAIEVAAGYFHTCALLYNGDIKCWGKWHNVECSHA